ncbi:MAG: excinuclease subunit [Pseudomonadota bacterium]
MKQQDFITVEGAFEHNLKDLSLKIPRGKITVITGVSGSGKSSLAFDTVLAESQRRFFYTLSHYSRQFLDLGSRPAVRKVSGLSPAIALAQNETQPSRRATVGTLTDLSELFAVMMARFGTKNCPEHGLPTSAQGIDGIVDRIMDGWAGQLVAVCVPVATSKKGVFRAPLTAFAEKGYLRAYIDGEMVSLSPVPDLAREEKHTIKLVVDQVKIKPGARERLQRSIEVALTEGKGFAEFFGVSSTGMLQLESGGPVSTKGGCPDCGFSWPKLDARYFSANSLGKCASCSGFGVVPSSGSQAAVVDGLDGTLVGGQAGEDDVDEVEFANAVVDCDACTATGVDARYAAIKLGPWNIQQIMRSPLREIPGILARLKSGPLGANPAFLRVEQEASGILDRILSIGLGYLHLARRVRSLSGGESQRLKLAGILSDSLRGVLYVLDEPSQGLHPAELDLLWAGLERLRDQGNTILIVDHDDALMRRADLIVDLGPGGGADGGRLLAQFAPRDAGRFVRDSRTAWHLSAGSEKFAVRNHLTGAAKSFIQLSGCNLHNLDIKRVRFLKSALNVVSGVSGAGKSSLVLGTLHRNIEAAIQAYNSGGRARKTALHGCSTIDGIEDIEQLHLIDRRPVAKSSVSMPASYLDVFGELRDLYAQLPDAQIAGLTARSFSLNAEGGRCEECRGRGEVSLSMRFLSDARVPCSVCEGKRYQPPVLAVTYNGINIAQALDLTIDQALEVFANHKMIVRRLSPAKELGLGYLKMGQPSASLSGGEAQRLKMVPFLTRRMAAGTVLVMDEPTTGLHFDDVARLLERLRHLVSLGATVIVVEHNTDVIMGADWLVDLGPGSAEAGGKLVYEGEPGGVVQVKSSPTGAHLVALQGV